MTGEKRKPLIIGKFKSPRCFKNADISKFDYKSNKNDWMTAELFRSMLLKWDSELRIKGRRILLLIDNCSCHPDISTDLTSIELAFLPPNTTSILQPMDAGIIRAFKQHYRKKMVRHLLQFVDDENNNKKFNITVLDALLFCDYAWRLISVTTIKNCFRHAGLHHNKLEVESEFTVETDRIMKINYGIDFNDYVIIDSNLTTCESFEDNVHDEVESERLIEDDIPTISVSTALESLRTVSLYYSQHCPKDTIADYLAVIEGDLDEKFMKSRMRQTKISDFLNKC